MSTGKKINTAADDLLTSGVVTLPGRWDTVTLV